MCTTEMVVLSQPSITAEEAYSFVVSFLNQHIIMIQIENLVELGPDDTQHRFHYRDKNLNECYKCLEHNLTKMSLAL